MIQAPIQVTVLDQTIDQILWNLSRRIGGAGMLLAPLDQVVRLQGSVVTAEALQNVFHPAPVLKHHARHLPKIGRKAVAMKADILGLCEEVVYPMTHFCSLC